MVGYVLPILFFLLMGAVIGLLLTFASKWFYVKTDETVTKLTEALPGANCGGCGYSGCAGYAEAVAAGEAPPNLCKPGGADTAAKIGEVLGISVMAGEKEVAFVRCNGNCGVTKDKFTYIGTESCAAVERFYNGRGECRARCHGLGDCASVCDYNAISVHNGIAVVDAAKCTGCGKCAAVCPNKLIVLVKASQRYMVRCSSPDNGKQTRLICKNGCISCGLCAKKCPAGAITLDDNHAGIDMAKCTGCGVCADVCPVKCIAELPVCTTESDEIPKGETERES